MRWSSTVLLTAPLLWASIPVHAAEAGAELLLRACGQCHAQAGTESLSRVVDQRKSPEGWSMTLARMVQLHGVKASGEEREAMVKYLADNYGLAPDEARPWRYMLERQPNVASEAADEELAVMCARCHSYGRVGLQRRSEADWRKLVHFHLGQWPTTEYQALARDRNWWEIASTGTPVKLAELFPLESASWKAWKARSAADLSGTWRFAGHQPGQGDFAGSMTLTALGGDRYDVAYQVNYAGGASLTGSGQGVLYTGYEWRATITLDTHDTIHQVLALDDGRLSGRWFRSDMSEIGADMTAAPQGTPAVLAVQPGYIKRGATTVVEVQGAGLAGEVDFGPGIKVVSTVATSPDGVRVSVRAAADAALGSRSVKVGKLESGPLFTVYDRVDSVRVAPESAIARVGGDGGTLDRVPAQFQAVGYMNGPDGKPGTEDDVRIGSLPAAWSVKNANEVAEMLKDTEFAGRMLGNGLFQPAAAGPNPRRPYGTNNAGDLTVEAVVRDGDATVSGSAHLIVTVQRWNDPLIR